MKKVLRILCILLLIALGIMTGFLAERFRPRIEPMDALVGEWVNQIDITETVAANAEIWLEDIEGVTVTTQEVKYLMGSLTVESTEAYSIDESGNAVCVRRISEESYTSCAEQAYAGMATAFEYYIKKRFEMAGMELTEEDLSVADLFSELFGMSMEEYLDLYAPDIMPTYMELNSCYTTFERKQVEE